MSLETSSSTSSLLLLQLKSLKSLSSKNLFLCMFEHAFNRSGKSCEPTGLMFTLRKNLTRMQRTEWSTRRSGWGDHYRYMARVVTRYSHRTKLGTVFNSIVCWPLLKLWAGDDPICCGGQWSGVPGQWQEAAGEENKVGNHWRYNPLPPNHLLIFQSLLLFCLNLSVEMLQDTVCQSAHNSTGSVFVE